MSRAKVKRKSTAIDMTAMCDVAFLLLTFFILSAKPKVEEPLPAVVPNSTAIAVIPETDFVVITVAQGKAFYAIEGDDVRRETIKAMGDAYKVPFTAEEVKAFGGTESFGVPLNVLPQYLSLSANDKKGYVQPGIPVDTTENNELYKWVYQTRLAVKLLHNKELTVGIKGDQKEEYPAFAMIIKTLQKQKVDKFSLITSLKTVAK